MTITFEITDEQQAAAEKILTTREGLDDIHALFRLEAFHNLGLTDEKVRETKVADLAERLKGVDADKLAEVEAIMRRHGAVEVRGDR